MAGKIRQMIDTVIKERAGGNPMLENITTTKFILKGLNPNKFTSTSDDDPVVIEKVLNIAKEFNIKL